MVVLRWFVWFVMVGQVFAQAIEFTAPSPITVPQFYSKSTADLFGTAHPEILLSTVGDTFTIIDRSTGGTTTSQSIALPSRGRTWAVGDIDLDGDQDICVHCRGEGSTPTTLSLLTQSNGTFTRTDFPGSYAILPLFIIDMNDDGWPDLLTRGHVLLNNGQGSFVGAWTSAMVADDTLESAVGDWDGDGDQDLVQIYSTYLNDRKLAVYENEGGGIFTPKTPITVAGDISRHAVGDMNGDGRDDVLLMYATTFDEIRVRTYAGQASGVLSAQGNFELCGNLDIGGAVEIGDLDTDGDLDVVASFSPSTECVPSLMFGYVVTTMLNDGTGRFVPSSGVGLARAGDLDAIRAVEIVDEDLDGDQDLLVSSSFVGAVQSNLSIMSNVPPTSVAPTITPIGLLPLPTIPLSIFVNIPLSVDFPGIGPAMGRIVDLSVTGTSPTAHTGPPHVVVQETGSINFFLSPGAVSSDVTIVASTGDASPFQFDFNVYPHLAAVSGNLQTACAGLPFGAPLVVRLLDASGSPIAGQAIVFGGDSSPGLVGAIVIPSTATTDAQGYAMTNVVAGALVGPVRILAGGTGLNSANPQILDPVAFDLTIGFAAGATAPLGSDQATSVGTAFLKPLEVEILDTNSQPIAGLTVTFTSSAPAGSIVLSSSTAVTDSQGRAQITASAGLTASPGIFAVRASTPLGQCVDFRLGVRRLLASPVSASFTLTYLHEHANVPIIVAADLPLPAPGFMTTPFGDIHTSILAPSPNLVVLDGLGIFGPANSSAFVGSGKAWTRTVSGVAALAGTTLVMQVYGYDVAYPDLDAYFVSNAVVVAF